MVVTVRDGKNASGAADTALDDTIAVTINVGNVDEPGTITLDTNGPRVGSAVTTNLSDPDGSVSGVTWKWENSADQTTWSAIASAVSASYTPVAADTGKYLRATASYTDGHGSSKTASGAAASVVQVADSFAAKWNNVPAQPWFHENYQPYSCATEEKTTSPWIDAGMADLGGGDPLSLIRYYGNGRYLRYEFMNNAGCTPTVKDPNRYYQDPPADPTYYSLGDIDIYVDRVHATVYDGPLRSQRRPGASVPGRDGQSAE